eukprot:1112047-Lingulodinium_polyedra.AAC.1
MDGPDRGVAFQDFWDEPDGPQSLSCHWVGRAIFTVCELEAGGHPGVCSSEESDAASDSIASTPGSPGSSDTENIAVDRPRP